MEAAGGHWLAGGELKNGRSGLLGQLDEGVGVNKKFQKTTVNTDGLKLTLYRVAEQAASIFTGHYVAVWRDDDVRYYVSLHGFANRRRTLLIARASAELLRKCRSQSPTAARCALVYDDS